MEQTRENMVLKSRM